MKKDEGNPDMDLIAAMKKRKRDDELLDVLLQSCCRAAQRMHGQLRGFEATLTGPMVASSSLLVESSTIVAMREALVVHVRALCDEIARSPACHQRRQCSSFCAVQYAALAAHVRTWSSQWEELGHEKPMDHVNIVPSITAVLHGCVARIAQLNMVPWRPEVVTETTARCRIPRISRIPRLPRIPSPGASSGANGDARPIPGDEAPSAEAVWVPQVLWDVFEVARKVGTTRSRAAMGRLLEIMHEQEPFGHMEVPFQVPSASSSSGKLEPSRQLRFLCAPLHARFGFLRSESYWILCSAREKDTREHCWRRLGTFFEAIHTTALHFHLLMQSLKTIAMGFDDLDAVTPSTHVDQISAAMEKLQHVREQGYEINANACSSVDGDALPMDTMKSFPEILVCIDQFRRDRAVVADVYDQHAVVVNVTDRQDPVLQQIAEAAKELFFTWRRSRLSKRDFPGLEIPALERLEREMKRKMKALIDLLYRVNLGRWRDRLLHGPWTVPEHLLRHESRETEKAGRTTPSKASDSSRMEGPNTLQGTASTSPATNPKRSFRAPQQGMVRDLVRTALSKSLAPTSSKVPLHEHVELDPKKVRQFATPHLMPTMCAWSDAEIDEHEQDVIQLYQLQNELWLLKKRSLVPKILGSPESARMSAWELVSACSRARATTEKAIELGDKVALHGVAEALLRTPALRSRSFLKRSSQSQPEPSQSSQLTSTDEGQTSEETEVRSGSSRSSSDDFGTENQAPDCGHNQSITEKTIAVLPSPKRPRHALRRFNLTPTPTELEAALQREIFSPV